MAIIGNRKGGPRQTKVARIPYWIPDINSVTGQPFDVYDPEKGHWRYLAADKTHMQQVSQVDPDEPDAPAFVQGQYESKGWIPLLQVPKNDPRRNKLPRNHGDLMHDHKVIPEMREKAAAK